MELTVARFREIYPEFDEETYPDVRVEYMMELAQEVHACSANAIYALTAHLLALAHAEGTGASGGTVTTGTVQTVKKARVGRVASEFVSMAGSVEDVYFEQTPYGKTYLLLSNHKRFSTRVL